MSICPSCVGLSDSFPSLPAMGSSPSSVFFPPATRWNYCLATRMSKFDPIALRATRLALCTFLTSQLPKVVREWCALYNFDFDMRFAPQRSALFRNLNFQEWSENGLFCAFWLRNMLRATTACTFPLSQLSILTSKCASRHTGVQFFISHLARWLRNRRFSEPTFRPSGATNHWKNTVLRDFPTFSRTCIFFILGGQWTWNSNQGLEKRETKEESQKTHTLGTKRYTTSIYAIRRTDIYSDRLRKNSRHEKW